MLKVKYSKGSFISITKKHIRKAGIFIFGCLIAEAIVTHDIWVLIITIPFGIYILNTKPEDRKEQEQEEELTWQSFSFALLLPAAIILVVLVYIIFWKLVPAIVQSL